MFKNVGANLAGILGSYGTSYIAWIGHVSDTVGVITAIAGAFLTVSLALVRIGQYKLTIEDVKAKKIMNEKEQLELNKLKNEQAEDRSK